MSIMDLDVEQRLDYLEEMLSCVNNIYFWTYNEQWTVEKTNCPDLVMDKVFLSARFPQVYGDYLKNGNKPVIISISSGLLWSVVFEKEKKFYVLGPVTTTELSHDAVATIAFNSKVTEKWRPKFLKYLRKIPIISMADFFSYTLMAHYCVNGEKITSADFSYYEPEEKRADLPVAKRDRMNTYMTEQALLRMVREGDLNYKSVLSEAAYISSGVRSGKTGTLEQAKVSQVVFTSLCTRAAIEGGLTPDMAYSKGDGYIRDIMKCRSIGETVSVGHSMYDDFVRTVHKGLRTSGYSAQIQKCCDYIDLHVEERISLSELASKVGYADYYLSRKFKTETGMNINDYIKNAKIERAKTLLLATDLSTQEICDRLQFGTRSFFAETFKKIAGIPPAEFRRSNLK